MEKQWGVDDQPKVLKLLEEWADDEDDFGRYSSYKDLLDAAMQKVQADEAKFLPSLATIDLKTGVSR